MPRAFDRRQMPIDRDPLNQLMPDFGGQNALGDFNLADILRKAIIGLIEELLAACTNVFLDGLKALGVGTTGLDQLGTGLQNFVDGVLRFLLCDPENPAGVTPQDFLTFLYGILTEIGQNPFVAGLIDLGDSFGAVGNAGVNKAFKGLLGVLESICSLVGVGELPANPGAAWSGTPQDIINFVKSVTDILYNNPIVSGLRDLVVDPAGNLLLDTLRGLSELLDRLSVLIGSDTTTPQDILNFFQGAVNTLWGILTATPNPSGKSVQDLVDAFTGWFDGVPVVSNIVNSLTGAPGDLDALKGWVEKNIPGMDVLVSALTGDSAGTFDLSHLGSWAQTILTTQRPVPADRLFGSIPGNVFGTLPVSHISITNANLLSQGSFGASGTITAADGWVWDGNENHSNLGSGSAKVTCNSTQRNLYSNQTVPVTGRKYKTDRWVDGDKLKLSAWVKTSSNFAGSGSSINLTIIPFIGTAPQTSVTVASRGATSNQWVSLSASESWTVPENVTSVRVRLAVTGAATAGSVWFDDVELYKDGLLGQGLVEYLTDAWNKLYQGAFGLTNPVTGKTWQDLLPALANPLAETAQVSGALDTFKTILNSTPEQVLGTIGAGIGQAAKGIENVLVNGVITFGTFISQAAGAAAGAIDGVVRGVTDFVNNLGTLLGVANDGVGKGSTAIINNQQTNKAVYEGYFGQGIAGTGAIAEVSATMSTIRTKIDQGYTLQSLTYNSGSRLVSLKASTDSSFGNVSILLHADGNDGSKYIPDSSLNNVSLTPIGNTQISSGQSKFGSTSLLFNGSSDYIYRSAPTSSVMGSGNWTLEMFFRPSQLPDSGKFAGLYSHQSVISYGGWENLAHTLILTDTGALYYGLNSGSTSTARKDISTAAGLITAGQWYHVAVVRNGATITLYIDGVSRGTVNVSTLAINTFSVGNGVETIGYYEDGATGPMYFNGNIDELRITKSVARYTAGFTPTTTAFPDLSTAPTAGTFTLTFGGQTTSSIAYNATAATVQSRLTSLSSIGSGKAKVTGNDGGPYTVTLDSTISSASMTATPSLTLTGGYATTIVGNGWVRPWAKTSDAPKEFYCVLFGAGGGGGRGSTRVSNTAGITTYGGDGGAAGGYAAIELDASELPETVPYTVAAGGLGSTNSSSATSTSESSFGSNTFQNIPYLSTVAGEQSVTSLLGYFATPLSAPGAGGGGGQAYSVQGQRGGNGYSGGATKLAAAGAGGVGSGSTERNPTPGSAGANASLTGKARAGGGGGGGGGSAWTFYQGFYYSNTVGQLGGNGGFPGGGGGGGGSAYVYDVYSANPAPRTPGNGGNGGNGVVVLIWK